MAKLKASGELKSPITNETNDAITSNDDTDCALRIRSESGKLPSTDFLIVFPFDATPLGHLLITALLNYIIDILLNGMTPPKSFTNKLQLPLTVNIASNVSPHLEKHKT